MPLMERNCRGSPVSRPTPVRHCTANTWPERQSMRRGAILNWLVYRYARARRRPPRKTRFAVGIFKPDRIGDFVLSIPTIKLIVDKHGAENCVLFHSDAVGELVAQHFAGVKAVRLPILSGRLWIDVVRLGRRLGEHPRDGIATERMYCLRHYRSLQDELMLMSLPTRRVVAVRNKAILGVKGEIVGRRFEGDEIYERPDESDGACDDLRCHAVVVRNAVDPNAAIGSVKPRFSRDTRTETNHLVVAPFGSLALRDLPSGIVKAVVEYCHTNHGLVPITLGPEDGQIGRASCRERV